MTDSNLNDLDPILQPLANKFLESCQAAGLECRIVVTFRDPTSQNKACAAGLSAASAGQSPHNCVSAQGLPSSRAFDFALFSGDMYITDGTDHRYSQAGKIAENLGLTWGGSWKHPDYDHCELMDWKNI